MSNLFSIFDPVALLGMKLNWTSSFLVMFTVPNLFWINKPQNSLAITRMYEFIYKEFLSIISSVKFPGMLLLSLSAFSLIVLNNFLGLAPYVFTATSHLSMSLALAMPLWIGHVVLGWIKSTKNMLAHLVPMGSPAALSPFMVLIELISAIIRPITLSVRLAANMVAGHLLMVLLSGPASSSSTALLLLILASLVLLGVLESAVATIQAYVFSILTVLYVNEINSPLMENFKNK